VENAITFYSKFITESASERILKIDYELTEFGVFLLRTRLYNTVVMCVFQVSSAS